MDFSNILIELNRTYILLREILRNLAVGMFLTARHLFSLKTRQRDSKYLRECGANKQSQTISNYGART